jgi:hypothetical protein
VVRLRLTYKEFTILCTVNSHFISVHLINVYLIGLYLLSVHFQTYIF